MLRPSPHVYHEQVEAEFGLQRMDLLGYGRLGNSQPVRRTVEIKLFADDDED